jgi:hypothetical protein
MNVFEYMELRFQWEETVREYKMDSSRKDGTVENLQWYIENGASKNRFRNGFKESHDIAVRILEKT